MTREEIETAIADLVDPGSMPTETIVEELAGEHDRREVKLVLVDMINDGRLEEHPEFTDAYRLPNG